MFGVRNLEEVLRDFTISNRCFELAGEAGRGGAAGGLIAAGLSAAIVFAPLATLPTVTGLGYS